MNNKIMKRKHNSSFREFDRRVSNIRPSVWTQENLDGFKAMRILLLSILFQILLWACFNTPHSAEMISPVPEVEAKEIEIKATETINDKFIPRANVDVQSTHTGIASYYSRSGCVGCSPTMTMANGEPLDDSRLTVAFNRAKLGSKVKVTNPKSGESVIATVTDTGGFERHGRIIDLTVATKDAINCSHLCEVKVEVL